MITKYQEVKVSKTKKGECPVCGRSVRKSKTFCNTINPWNRNSDGNVKSWKEVHDDVCANANNWYPDFTHEKCK